MYEHRYKFGKVKDIMPNTVFEAAVKDSINRGETLNHLAFVVLLWHTGVRKSEAYERAVSDVTLDDKFVTIDFHQRKKGGEDVSPLNIPKSFFGVQEFLVPWIKQRQNARRTWKTIYRQAETGETRTTKKGNIVTVKKTEGKRQRDRWLFPHISSVTAWYIVKNILGPKYYPHYLRLRKLSRIASNPKTRTIEHIKNVSGLKTLTAIGAYMGTDKKIQREAMEENE